MNVNPYAHFVFAIALFGMMAYFFNPITTYITTLYPPSGDAALLISFLYWSLPAVNFFGSSFRLIQEVQQQ
jgi:hypothetical protein